MNKLRHYPHAQPATNYLKTIGSHEMGTNDDNVAYILELLKGLRADANNPYKSNKAGDMIDLLKKINRKLDNYDRKQKSGNRRI